MAKAKRFESGGMMEDDVTPQDVSDAKMRVRAGRAYDKAMPEVDTTFDKLRSPTPKSAGLPPPKTKYSSKYSSVRGAGFEEGVDADKMAAIKQGIRGAGKMVGEVAKSAIPGGQIFTDPYEGVRGGKMARDAIDRYKGASARQDAADRELADQMRRETRGVEFSKGGKVGSASKRADGIAQRGKTRGKFC